MKRRRAQLLSDVKDNESLVCVCVSRDKWLRAAGRLGGGGDSDDGRADSSNEN